MGRLEGFRKLLKNEYNDVGINILFNKINKLKIMLSELIEFRQSFNSFNMLGWVDSSSITL